jgi:hypothetical protein
MEQDDVGRWLAQDRKRKAEHETTRGQGGRGDPSGSSYVGLSPGRRSRIDSVARSQ